jgi:type IV secretion system protein TrbE
MATNNARDNLKKQEYFDRLGFADGLRHLAEDESFQQRGLAVSTTNTNS